jgi:hypothetical protein
MPTNRGKPWERLRSSGRQEASKERRRLLILCEDSKSSVLYFKGFPVVAERVLIETVGTGMNTDSLVEDAIRRQRAAVEQQRPYSSIWCVMDRDSFPAQNFNRARTLAENSGIRIAWANECFELWYLLHFNYHDTAISRDHYAARLSKLLGFRYEKSDPAIYQHLKQHHETAIRNARTLMKHWEECNGCNPERCNPSTNIHELALFLNDLVELGPAS